eukprot:368343-Amphidinium_carterae.1
MPQVSHRMAIVLRCALRDTRDNSRSAQSVYGLGVSLRDTRAQATQRSEYPQKTAKCNHTEIDVGEAASVCCDDVVAADVECLSDSDSDGLPVKRTSNTVR